MRAFDLTSLPAVTRVLLASDGSTTRSLQAIIGSDVRLEVTEERATGPDEFLDERLHVSAGGPVMLRRSRLVMGDRVLTCNIVLYPSGAVGWSPADPLPLGLQLRRMHTPQHREILAVGVDDESGQAFKEYVIETLAGRGRTYVREVFSPLVAPVGDTVAEVSGKGLFHAGPTGRPSGAGRCNR